MMDEESALLPTSSTSSSSTKAIAASSSSSSPSRMSKVTIAVLAVTLAVLAAVATYNYKGINAVINSARTDDDEYGNADNEGSWSVSDDEAKKTHSNVHGLTTTDFGVKVASRQSAEDGNGVSGDIQKCLDWQQQYHVKPDIHWGTFPQAKKAAWRALKCDEKLEIHAQAMKYEAKHGPLNTPNREAERPMSNPAAVSNDSNGYMLKNRVGPLATSTNFNAVGANPIYTGVPLPASAATTATGSVTNEAATSTTLAVAAASPLPQAKGSAS